MVQRCVAEDRIARAGRTRPHKLDTGALIPGTTMVDFYRESQGDVGWRGPASLLRLDKDEGTAILSYHKVDHISQAYVTFDHTPGVFFSLGEQQRNDLDWIGDVADKISPYKPVVVGWIPEIKNHCTSWKRASSSSLAYHEAWTKIVAIGRLSLIRMSEAPFSVKEFE